MLPQLVRCVNDGHLRPVNGDGRVLGDQGPGHAKMAPGDAAVGAARPGGALRHGSRGGLVPVHPIGPGRTPWQGRSGRAIMARTLIAPSPTVAKGSLHGHIRGPTRDPLERDPAGEMPSPFHGDPLVGRTRHPDPGRDRGGRGRPRGGGEALPDRSVRSVRGTGRGRDRQGCRRPAVVPAQDPGRMDAREIRPRRWPRSKTA